MPIDAAKIALDHVIGIAREHWYKPIQVAEVLYHSRTDSESDIDPTDVETYRNQSIHWRNAISRRLLGKVSTSSARYQHDVWNEHAIPPYHLKALIDENEAKNGIVETYIYGRFELARSSLRAMIETVENATPDAFEIEQLLDNFRANPSLSRISDKLYEIVAYTVLSTVLNAIDATVTVSLSDPNDSLLTEFQDLIGLMLGVSRESPAVVHRPKIYRVGATNAADSGIDMWANYGPIIQVKHISLNSQATERIVDRVESDRIVIICRQAEREVIESVLAQIGWWRRVQGIIEEELLVDWYRRCLNETNRDRLAVALLNGLREQIHSDFPYEVGLAQFLRERGYNSENLSGFWSLNT